MIGTLVSTRWYQLTAADNPIPSRLEGWVDFGPSVGVRWLVLVLMGE